MARRTPPKQRHHDRPAQKQTVDHERASQPKPDGSSAPSHVAGTFDEAGYGSGHGSFGFTQHVLP